MAISRLNDPTDNSRIFINKQLVELKNDIEMQIRSLKNGWHKSFQSESIGVSTLNAGNINCPLLIKPQPKVDIYISSSTGNDSTGDGTSSKPYKTIQKALNSLNKYLTGNVNIYPSGAFNEFINIQGFIGHGALYLNLGTSIINGQINVATNTCYINICGASDTSRATINAISNNMPIRCDTNTWCYCRFLTIDAKNLASYAAYYTIASGRIEACTMKGGTYAGACVTHGNVLIMSCKGTNATYGVIASDASIVAIYQTIPKGASGGSVASYGVIAGSATAVDESGSTGVIQTTTQFPCSVASSYRTYDGYWNGSNNGYVYQGQWDVWGVYTGCMWFNGLSVLTGKTIKAARLYLHRVNAGGIYGAVPTYLGCTTATGPGARYSEPSFRDSKYIGDWARNEAKWVAISTAYIQTLAAYPSYGLAINHGSNDYEYFYGAGSAILEVTYQ